MPAKWLALAIALGWPWQVMAADAGGETPPDEAFLEFLGEWETEDGQWYDPLEQTNSEDEENTHDES
jgi:hypothetical protein